MMKTYFTRLFDYDQKANEIMINTILENGFTEKPVQLMAHLLAAQEIWLGRCKQEIVQLALWPDWKIHELEAINLQNHQQWIQFIDRLHGPAFEELVAYKNSQGQSYTNLLSDLLAHVINHGTHHRAQIGQQLKFEGVEKLPLTDYIFFRR